MQPTVMKVLQAARQAVNRGPLIVDTHKQNGLTQPTARPDACSLHTSLSAWAQVVVLWEFKIHHDATSLHTMAGQQITRSRHVLDHQLDRNLVVTVCLTMDTLELLWIHRRAHGDIAVARSGQQPLSFCPQSSGFMLLVQLLATPEVALGFSPQAVPAIAELGEYSISEVVLMRRGTAPHGHGSHVYQVTASGPKWQGPAILKLHDSEKEVRHHNTGF